MTPPGQPPHPVPGVVQTLLARDLAGVRLLLLEGRSGSGKSTAIATLLARHPDFAGQPRTEIQGGPIVWRGMRPSTPLVVVDELTRLADVPPLVRLLARGHRVIAASHLPGAWLAHLGPCLGIAHAATDRDPATIERYLQDRGVSHTRAGIARFCHRFGATYTDADIVLEHAGGNDFDHALTMFERRCTLRMRPRRRETVMRIVR